MKKKLNIFFGLIVSFLMMIIPLTVGAIDDDPMITVEASQSNGTVYVHGTTTDVGEFIEVPILAVAVAVYKENGTDLVTMQTTQVYNHEYSTYFSLPDGTYLIKVANYDGGYFVQTTITVNTKSEEEETTPPEEDVTPTETNEEQTTDTSENPITTDNIMRIAAVFALAVIGLFSVIMINRKIQKGKSVK